MTVEQFAPLMFLGLILVMLIGFPVAFSLAALGLFSGLYAIDMGWFPANFLGNLPLTETGLPPKVTVEPVFLADFFAVFLTAFFFAFFALFFFDAMVSPGHVVLGRPLRADCSVDAIKSAPTTHHW